MATIAYTSAAAKQLRRLPPNIRSQIESKLRRYVDTGAGDVKALTGVYGIRLRIGDYRVIFPEDKNGVVVRAIGHRRDVYR